MKERKKQQQQTATKKDFPSIFPVLILFSAVYSSSFSSSSSRWAWAVHCFARFHEIPDVCVFPTVTQCYSSSCSFVFCFILFFIHLQWLWYWGVCTRARSAITMWGCAKLVDSMLLLYDGVGGGGGGGGGVIVLCVRTYINDFPTTYTNPKYAEHFLCVSG